MLNIYVVTPSKLNKLIQSEAAIITEEYTKHILIDVSESENTENTIFDIKNLKSELYNVLISNHANLNSMKTKLSLCKGEYKVITDKKNNKSKNKNKKP